MSKPYNRAFVLMTALVPTKGHVELIKFASEMASKTIVLIQGRTFEPVDTKLRAHTIEQAVGKLGGTVLVCYWEDDNAPQVPDPEKEVYPGADTAFWNYWCDEIRRQIGYEPHSDDVFIASEEYGAVLAKYLNCSFVPFDIKREFCPIKGTDVRANVYKNWDKILPKFRPYLAHNVVMFGQESVGKTTLARAVTKLTNGLYVPEWARGYLESPSIGPEVTLEKMRIIGHGQIALEKRAISDVDHLVRVFDTDILATIGYYRIFSGTFKQTEEERWLYSYYEHVKKHRLYFLLPDNIPFEQDQLRYGGDKRESTVEFWRDLLEEFGCEYIDCYEYPDFGQEVEERAREIQNVINMRMGLVAENISNFVRET